MCVKERERERDRQRQRGTKLGKQGQNTFERWEDVRRVGGRPDTAESPNTQSGPKQSEPNLPWLYGGSHSFFSLQFWRFLRRQTKNNEIRKSKFRVYQV